MLDSPHRHLSGKIITALISAGYICNSQEIGSAVLQTKSEKHLYM